MSARRRIAVLAVAAVALTGCSRAVSGTPVAAPGQAGIPEPASALQATCREYTAMSPPARRAVITAIGEEGNQLVASNPDLWVGVAAALCRFVDPSAPVRDVLTGGIR